MANFNPDSADRKDVLKALTAKHEHVLRVVDSTDIRAFVTWDSNSEEKDFLRAIQLGLSALRTDCTDEWIVVGNGVFAYMRYMGCFVELDQPEIACGLVFIGHIRRMRVYLRPWPGMASVEFYMGHRNSCAKGAALNFAMNYADEHPEQVAPPPAEMVDPNDACFGIYDARNNQDEEVYVEEEPEPPRDNDPARSPIWDVLHGWLTDDGKNPF